MSTGMRKCKICGCEYPYCKTVTKDKFRYQDVACSPEHAAEYFRQIELSRTINSEYEAKELDDIYYDEFDEDEEGWFDDCFDETDDEEDIVV